ncbi:MAG: bifunctional UDP-N-acetylglucosamine diphosphorylase/glucosamine-1-phosphate N-acetyltransferase GlmU [Alphaproteobacteria bacterium]|nr:bifunctional UDP-N-acetylglucosamine diphosphorylase/glucosamine-1-phosphate N-acetyltransferase GlmU [Alphaproteobacteria bacterium]
MTTRTCLTIVLAAGEGTRLRSSRPKVLHEVAGRTLLGHVLTAVKAAQNTVISVVLGPEHDVVSAETSRVAPEASVFIQTERRGTAHAVLAARSAIEKGADDVLVIFGDTPLIQPQTLQRLRTALADGAAVAVLGFRPADPTGYGRLVTQGDDLLAIVEHADATEAERAIGLCNGGLMGLDGKTALSILERIGNANRKGEFYLTDAVKIARDMERKAVALEVTEDEVSGINTKAQLAATEATMQQRLRQAALEAGVTLVSPDTVHFSADTKLGRDVTIEPFVVFGPGVTVEDGATIRSFSHLQGAQVGKGAIVGPFARLRPGAKLEENVHIGNFVEVKEALIEAGAKANHLAYIGDARVGAGANVGAGTITCNYDGAAKHRTDIGKGAFIGSNSSLVAPVKIGDGAYIGSGSVITADVPADALAIGRGRQTLKEGWAKRLRDIKGLIAKKA